jgi:hypothetical protein
MPAILAANARNRPARRGVHGAMKRTAPGIILLLLLAACAAPGGAAPSSSSSGDPSAPASGNGGSGDVGHPTGATDAILVVDTAGGFAMPSMVATRVPQLAVYGDGRVIMQGAQTLEFPGPALPPLIERTMTEEGIQALLSAIEDTNLFTEDHAFTGAMAVVADAADTVFTLRTDDREVTVSIYGLGTLDPAMGVPPGVDQGEIQAHGILGRLNEALMTLDTWIPSDAWESEGWQPYQPDAFRLYVRDVTGEPMDGELQGQVREWPTDDDPAAFGEEVALFGDGSRCGVVDGEAGTTWLAELSASNQNTQWTDDGERRFSVLPRPLLPHDEHTCPELAPAG